MAKKKSDKQSATGFLKKELETNPTPRLADIAIGFIRHAGGVENFSKLAWDEYYHAAKGSVARQRIMSSMIQCLGTAKNPYTSESLDDLEDADVEMIFKRYQQIAGVTYGEDGITIRHDAPAGPAADAEVKEKKEGDEPGAGREVQGASESEDAGRYFDTTLPDDPDDS